jgi:glutamine amidotransferase-like uncharacterized protein
MPHRGMILWLSLLIAFSARMALAQPGATLSGQVDTIQVDTIKVALYADQGTSGRIDDVLRALESDSRLQVTKVMVDDIRAGALAGYDVLVHPGGSGGGQGRALGAEGRTEIRRFVRDGGGYVGICAGAYLASCHYPWSLNLLNAQVVDSAHWARGYGDVEISVGDLGRSVLGVAEERLTIYYHQGPLLAPADHPGLPAYVPLARFETEIAKNGAPEGVMIGTTAIAASRFGKGRVLCFSPHPERTTGLERITSRGVAWAAGEEGRDVEPPAAAMPPEGVIRVAIYDHSDGTAKAPGRLKSFLTAENGFACTRVRPEDIREGCLADFDVLIMPGGSGSRQAANLTVQGREEIQRFVREGGGYVGICAGAYLATSFYDWSLHLINARVIDREHWARGTGMCRLSLTPAGRAALGHDREEVSVYYGQGPLLGPDDKSELPAYESLATYATEIAKKGAPTGVMIGTTAIARAHYGEGRVICFSPHPESSGGPNHLVLEGVRWAGARTVTATAAE